MKHLQITILLVLFSTISYAQTSFVGIQNNPRRSMVHAIMNPAEITHLHNDIEVNIFAVGATVNNDVLTYNDLISGDDLWERAFDRTRSPINLRAEVQVLGPSFGIKVNNWAFGFTTQAIVRADILDFSPDLGSAFNRDYSSGFSDELNINNPYNQRVNAAGWMELGFLAGREIFHNLNHHVSAGANLKLLIPGMYINLGMDNIQGNINQNLNEINFTNASGAVNINYPSGYANDNIFTYARNNFNLGNTSGVALDLGLTHHFRQEGITILTSGIALKNMGGMGLGRSHVNNTYSMIIPQGESFRIDLLDGEPQDIEARLLESGYFTRSNEGERARMNLPTILSAYTDYRINNILSVGIFGQRRLSNNINNNQIISQNIISITPRVVLGHFEVYSPWARYEVSGVSGGLGLRYGGFFVGSQSIITGLLSNKAMMADAHIGLSLGFGKKSYRQRQLDETSL